jgi:hypothetical protein
MTSQSTTASSNRQFGGQSFINDRNLVLSSLYELSFQQEQTVELEQLEMNLNDPEKSTFEIRIHMPNNNLLINHISLKDDKIILGHPELLETCTFTSFSTLKQCFNYIISVIIKGPISKSPDVVIDKVNTEEQKSSDITQETPINTISDITILMNRLKLIENNAILNDADINKLKLQEQTIIQELKKVVFDLENKLIAHKVATSEAEAIRTQLEKLKF